jgi:hypothetical protein
LSGYLSTLLGRAIGTPAAAVAPRMGPVFPVGRQPLGGEPAAGEAALDGAQAPPPSELVGGPDVAPVGAPASPAAAGRRPRAAEIASDRRYSSPPVPTAEPLRPSQALPGTAGGVPPAPTRDPVASPAKAAVRPLSARDDKDARVEVRVETRVERQEPASAPAPPEEQPTLERPRAQPVLALPRAVTRHLPERGALARPSPDRPPRIEVQIGRVEIRRPFEPQPVEWSAPPVEAQPVTSFAELAAARRYVDRGWS